VNPADRLGDVGSFAEDDDALPGRDMAFEGTRPSRNARRDWRRDAALQQGLYGHLLKDDHSS
jgi:hypothetical protein